MRRSHHCFTIVLLILPSLACAAMDQGDMLTTVLNGLVNLLTSTPARLMAVLAIIGIGYSTIALGTIPKSRAITTVVGLGLVFGASFILQNLGLNT